MRRLISFIGLQAYALTLAWWQFSIGVRTDEAKYLLDIPYPHPPFARWTINLTEQWSGHELFWRIVFATLLVQAVWLVIDLVRDLRPFQRAATVIAYLSSAAVLYQAGTVMMAPLTALQMLVFVWLLLRGKDNSAHAALIGLFWLASLFTAYQAVLFAPLVAAVVLALRIPLWKKGMLFAAPVALLALYTLTNPLALASMVNHGAKDASQTLPFHLTETLWIWAIGGSGLYSILGTAGLIMKPRWGIIGSFVLVTAYIFLSRYDYYAILFTPLLASGFTVFMMRFPRLALPVALLLPVGTLLILHGRPPQTVSAHLPQQVLESAGDIQGDILISGSFGHEWQFATSSLIKRYDETLLPQAGLVVCLAACPDMTRQPQWMQLPALPVDVWMKTL